MVIVFLIKSVVVGVSRWGLYVKMTELKQTKNVETA
jgi:hypothetical protein